MDGAFWGTGINEEKGEGLEEILTNKGIKFGEKVFFEVDEANKILRYPTKLVNKQKTLENSLIET
jgi:hypothetical protein